MCWIMGPKIYYTTTPENLENNILVFSQKKTIENYWFPLVFHNKNNQIYLSKREDKKELRLKNKLIKSLSLIYQTL